MLILLTGLLLYSDPLAAQSEAFLNDLSQKLMSGEISQEEAIRRAQKAGVTIEDLNLGQQQPSAPTQAELQEADEAAAPDFNVPDQATTRTDTAKKEEHKQKKEEKLDYFGYNLFEGAEDKYNRLDIGTIDPNYQVGPGDEIILTVWGQVERRNKMTVSREGTIFVKQYGQMNVAGLTLEQLESKMERNLSRIYSGLGRGGGTYLDVSLGELRSILVYVVGDVKSPGSHFMSNYSTAFTALHKAGGATNEGSLRKIQVIRNDEVVSTLDLYNFLTTGRLPNDVRLQNNDVIYVPPRISTVVLKGEVRNPAIYEPTREETFRDLLGFAGGMQTSADITSIQIERIVPLEKRHESAEVYKVFTPVPVKITEEGLQINEIELNDKDVVTVLPVTGQEPLSEVPGGVRFAYVSGHVYKPGRYMITDSSRILNLLEKGGGLKDSIFWSQTYQLRADLIRYTGTNNHRKVIPVSLKDVLAGDQEDNIVLHSRDSLIVYSTEVLYKSKSVTIQGEVEEPGTYSLFENMGIHDLLLQAGGFTKRAYRYKLDVFRLSNDDNKEAQVIHVDISPEILREKSDTIHFLLKDYDMVVVRRNPDFEPHKVVYLGGEVKYPGAYSIIKPNETLNNLITRAGGFTDEAFVPGITYKRNGKEVVGDFEKAFSKERTKILLMGGDSIMVPRHPSTVRVTGNVRNPGLVQYNQSWSLNKYVEAAGDYDFDAAKGKTVVYYPGGYAKRKHFFWSPNVKEGSVIFVPEKPEREPVDVTRLMAEWASIATSVVLIIYITKGNGN